MNKKMNFTTMNVKKIVSIFTILLLVLTILFVFKPITTVAAAEDFGQTKIKEGFESVFPPPGWTIFSVLSVVQTTGLPGGECMGGHHAAKIFRNDTRFFCQMFTPLFNGKKGGGNLLTFWHKQVLNGQFVILATNGSGDWVQVADYPSNMDWTYEKINLNDLLHPTKTMQVCFLTILFENGDNVYLDEVTITGVSGE
jgi:hypothetical protein